MSYREHAELEFKAAGWTDEFGNFKDGMQELMCKQILELLDLFSKHGHSGLTAPYAINLFKVLASFEPIVPLTGEDWEWIELEYGDGDMKYQNKRCSHVFKDKDGTPYDSEGIIFWEWYERDLEEDEEGYPGVKQFKAYFTNNRSRQFIEFPYTPEKIYIERTTEKGE